MITYQSGKGKTAIRERGKNWLEVGELRVTKN